MPRNMQIPLTRLSVLALVAISTRCLLAQTNARDAAMRNTPTAMIIATRHLTGRESDHTVRMHSLKLFILFYYNAFLDPGVNQLVNIGRSLLL